MKKFIIIYLVFLALFITGSVADALGQSENQFAEPPPRRPNLLQALGLTQDQVRQLRQLNTSMQPQLRESERAMRQAKQSLDEAIYSDELSDQLIQERLQIFQKAQFEVAKNRTMMETSVRKILTRDQLFKFKRLRQNFQPKPNNNPENRPNQLKRPLPKRMGRPAI